MTILEVSAAQLGDKISRGELTSTEVTEFFIERIEKYNLEINAVIDTRFDKGSKVDLTLEPVSQDEELD